MRVSIQTRRHDKRASCDCNALDSRSFVEKWRDSVRVTDIRGQEIVTFSLPAYENETLWDASKTFGGTYFITVTIGDVSETTKILRR